MRKLFNEQMKIGAVDISNIKIDKKSRDEIPKTLIGLQSIFTNSRIRERVFAILKQAIPAKSLKGLGRHGMSGWEIFVLAAIKLSCDADYDHLKEISDNHKNVRLMLGLSPLIDEEFTYGLQTLKDNIGLLTEEKLKQINQVVVEYGHQICEATKQGDLHCRCDSYVVLTDVHFPTDIGLMFDAIRKVIILTGRLCDRLEIPGWRNYDANIKAIKKRYRLAQKLKHSTSKNEEMRKKRSNIIKEAYLSYIELVRNYLQKTTDTLQLIEKENPGFILETYGIEYYIEHAERQIDQTYRRVIENEKIPHHEKVFSIFETHTEWISKGKAGVPQELGRRVAIIEDQYGFILDYYIGKQETDDQIAIPLIQSAKKAFSQINSCSFDKAFYKPSNKKDLKPYLNLLVLPKKGKRNKAEQQEESKLEFQKARKQHSAVESAIASLQNHGLKKCRNKGEIGFNKYVAMGILAFNIHKLGAVIGEQHRKSESRRKKYLKTYEENRHYLIA
ncbi:MAG: ISNCY family transposase [Desulfobacteraceae bacterium]|nr:ISNCY family transposase [Desulfobacteraceae bacterium]